MNRRLALLALILLAFTLRLYELDAQSLWYDEGVTAQVARLGAGELTRWTAEDIQPPLYYLLVGGWLRLNPFGEWILRWPSAAFGLLLVPLLWALGRRLWDERAGLLAALAAATSPLMVYYGQEARMYTLLVSLITLAALALLRWQEAEGEGRRAELRPELVEEGRGRGSATAFRAYLSGITHPAVVYGLAALGALYTHYFAGFALLALALYWLIGWARRRGGRSSLLSFVWTHALVGLAYLPWLPAMFNRLRADSSYWQGTLKLGEALLDVALNFTAGASEVMLEMDARAWLVALFAAALVWVVMAGQQRQSTRRPLLLLALWGLLPVVLILALAYRTPKFNARYLLVSWPTWALLAGGGLSALWAGTSENVLSWASLSLRRLLFFATLLLLLAAHGLGLYNWFADDNFAKSAWREAITEMYTHRQADEAALLLSGHAYPVFDTYLPPRFGVERYRLPPLEILDVNEVIGWAQAAAMLNQVAAAHGGVWLFTWQDEVVDPAGVTVTLLDRYALWQATPDFAYIGLRHYRFLPGQAFPAQPPSFARPADFGGALRLLGMEANAEGVWLYWQALRPDLPDLQVAITLRSASGQVLADEDTRPVGYEFPTTRWQAGEVYPVFLPVALDPGPLTLEIRVYEYESGHILGAQRLFDEGIATEQCDVCSALKQR